MDTLSSILDLFHFKGSFYYATNFQAPWGIEVPLYKNVARFHYVTQGSCWVRIDGVAEPQLLASGDLIIIPHGAMHILSDDSERQAIPLEQAYDRAGYHGEGIFQLGAEISAHDTQLVCGHFEFDEMFSHPLIDNLPKFIIKNETDNSGNFWVKDILRFMSHLAKSQQDGSEAIIKRLSEVIFIQAIRTWYQTHQSDTGFIAALNDPQLSKGLNEFHQNYSESWTVQKLAEKSGMSRSLFSDKFKLYLGLSPMQYVTHWRMQNAKQLLKDRDISIGNIAYAVGYDSVPSFSKAFKRLIGRAPGEYRRLLSSQAA